MKLFFYITAHKNPRQLARLVRTLAHSHHIVCIHVDAKSQINDFRSALASQSNIQFITSRTKVNWAGYSQVEAVLSGLREFSGSGCSHFILLSGQDYPIKPLADFESFLEYHPGKNFIELVKVKEHWPGAIQRTSKYHFIDYFEGRRNSFRLIAKLINKAEGLVNIILNLKKERSMPLSYKLYGGSSWFVFTSMMSNYILSQINKHPELISFFKFTANPDEHFFHTLIGNSDLYSTVVENNLRYIKFLPNKNNPEILTANDFDKLSSAHNKFFARKFDETADLKIFELLDKLILTERQQADT